MLAAKLLGRKSGSGFYKYEGKQQVDNEALEEWREVDARENFAAARMSLIVSTACFLMVNEAARCLEEKVVGYARGRRFRDDDGDRLRAFPGRAAAIRGSSTA